MNKSWGKYIYFGQQRASTPNTSNSLLRGGGTNMNRLLRYMSIYIVWAFCVTSPLLRNIDIGEDGRRELVAFPQEICSCCRCTVRWAAVRDGHQQSRRQQPDSNHDITDKASEVYPSLPQFTVTLRKSF